MSDDTDLLRRFAESGSESDFAEVVRRNASLVYHAALRRTGGRADLAEDVSQQVFAVLARNAAKLVRHTSLAGWLYTTTRQTSYRLMRADARRRQREQQFAVMTELTKSEAQVAWEKFRPELDRLLDHLSDSDREALLLRYLQGHSVAEVAAAIGLAPESARKRIERAVDRLRSQLVKRGLTTSATVVAELLANEVSAAMPPQLINRLADAALKQALPSASSAAIAAGSATLSSAAAFGIAIALLGGAGAVGYTFYNARAAQAEVGKLQISVRASEARLRTIRAQAAPQSHANPVTITAASSANSMKAATASLTSNAAAPKDAASDTLDALQNGARFLATVPEARAKLTSFEKTQMHATFAGFYRAAHMTLAEVDAFEQRVADYHLSRVELSENRMVTTAGDLPVDQVSALLGSDRGEIYAHYLPKMPARNLALEAAATVNYAAAPASPAQVDELTQVLADASPAYKSGGHVDLAQEDWASALPRLQTLFTPEQWDAVQGLFLGYAYQQALQTAQSAATTAPIADAGNGKP